MPEEEIDKLLRDAANQHHPPYDDTAWGKMEVLLDKHLPEKKDRKRPVIFLLIFLLVGGAIFWGIQAAQNNGSKTIAEKTSNSNTGAAAVNTIPDKTADKNNGTTSANTNIASLPATNGKNEVVSGATNKTTTSSTQSIGVANQSSLNNNVAANNNDQTVGKGKSKKFTNGPRTKMNVKSPNAVGDENTDSPKQKNTVTKNGDDNAVVTSTDDTKNIVVDNNDKTIVKKDDGAATKKDDKVDVAKTDTQKTPEEKNNTTASSTKQKKNKKIVEDRLALTASVGADLSYVTLNNAGKVKPVYGAGIKYNISKHVAISSGLNISKKVYSALPTQYKFAGYTNPNLVKINADCNVYEIPLTVYYNFAAAKKHGWFAGAGLSSFIMKKEYYDYQYQSSTGMPYSYDKTINNENKHFLSVLSLSAGYQYNLSKRVALTAEPYLKVPLSGIGLGKIKLNSTGVLITAAIKPFSKKKK